MEGANSPKNNFVFTYVLQETNELSQKYKKEYGTEILKRLKFILENENVDFNPKDLPTIIKNSYPSIREMTVMLQKLTTVVDGKNTLVIDDKLFETAAIMNKLSLTLYSCFDLCSICQFFSFFKDDHN